MPSELQDRLTTHLEPVVASAGLYLEDVKVSAAGRRTLVRVVVDLPDGPGGVSSDALAEVSRAVSKALDDADLVRGAHTLEVTTPGVDRPLTQRRHFRRAVGRLVSVTTAAGTSTGRLTDVGDSTVVVGDTEFPLDAITLALVQVELARED